MAGAFRSIPIICTPIWEDGNLVDAVLTLKDISERKRVEKTLRESEERFRKIFDEGPLGMAMVGVDYRFVRVNTALCQMLGYSEQELTGLTFVEITHPEDIERDVQLTEKVFSGQIPYFKIEKRYVKKNREILWIGLTATVIRDEGGKPVYGLAMIEDITERKRAEGERARYAAQLQGLAKASLVINSTLSLDDVLKIVTEKAREIIGAHQSVTSMTVHENCAQAINAVSLSHKHAAYEDYGEKADAFAIYRLICQTNRPMRITQAELEAHPEWRGFTKAAGKHPPMRGWLAAPLTGSDGQNIGLIQLSDKTEGEFTEDDEAILVQLAQMASVAVENARLFEQVHAGRERLQSLSRRLVEVQETEHRQIARELHDEIGQALTGLKLAIEMSLRSPADAATTSLNDARALVNELMGRVRELSLDLRPPMLDDLGLLPALLWHFERYAAQTKVCVVFKQSGLEGRFAREVETAAYRIVQEALTNVARHAGAREAAVRLWTDQGTLTVQIEDQGKGFNPEAAQAGGTSGGLVGMHERAVMLGGRLTVESAPRAGTRVTAELLLSDAAETRKEGRSA